MAATRPIVRDPLEGKGESLEDKYRLVQRERPRSIAGRPLQSNPLGNALAGYKARSKTSIRGGTFAPRAVSGMR